MPKGRQSCDLLLLLGEMPALRVGFGGRGAQPLIRIGEPRVFFRVDIGLVLRYLARFLLTGQIAGKS